MRIRSLKTRREFEPWEATLSPMPTELPGIGDGVASYRRNGIKPLYNSGH
jgi:hypothetical protein